MRPSLLKYLQIVLFVAIMPFVSLADVEKRNFTLVIDAGHGGSDFGATYNGRKEKDDTLRLVMEIGRILQENCVNVEYTRTTDVYNTPYEKAVIANNSDADFFVSIHRNAYTVPNTTSGVETLVYNDNGIKAEMARNINSRLSRLGFINRGVIERPNLVVLKRTRMPAILVEAGFIDSDKDNALFDESFDEIAMAIAMGIIETIGGGCDKIEGSSNDNNHNNNQSEVNRKLYRVQVGAYRNREYADELVNELKDEGYPAFIVLENGLYKVQSGAFAVLDNAVRMEDKLRRAGYNTFIID